MEISCTCKIVKNFKCEKCEKTFTRNSDLNGHMKSAHKELIFQNVKCEICHDSFLNMQNLKVHLKIGHEGQEFFECDLCSVIFWTTNCLEKHIKVDGNMYALYGKSEQPFLDFSAQSND